MYCEKCGLHFSQNWRPNTWKGECHSLWPLNGQVDSERALTSHSKSPPSVACTHRKRRTIQFYERLFGCPRRKRPSVSGWQPKSDSTPGESWAAKPI